MSKHAHSIWAIVADDLTGAADAAAAYGPTHRSCVVLELHGEWPGSEILAINTESRYLSEGEAATAVGHAVGRALGQGRRVFKKLDSLLRGNVGAELAAAASTVSGNALVIVAPAFPATGRTTINGVVHVDGEANAEGKYGGDIRQALAAGGLSAETVTVGPSRHPEELAGRLSELHRRGVRAAVVDAQSDDDLRIIARAAEIMEVPTLLAGSGGLAGQIDVRGPVSGLPLASDRDIARTLLVIGSYSPLAQSQVQQLVATGIRHVKLNHEDFADPAVHVELLEALDDGDAVLTPDPSAPLDKSQAAAVAGALASATAAARSKCGAFLLTGGETATAVLAELGVTSFTVLGEIEPGVVASRLDPSLPLMVTKAGAFGDGGTLLRTAQFLKSTTTETSIK